MSKLVKYRKNVGGKKPWHKRRLWKKWAKYMDARRKQSTIPMPRTF